MAPSIMDGHPVIGGAVAKLRAAGLRITGPRVALLKGLLAAKFPIGLEDLRRQIGEECDLVTTYRCMDKFESVGLVRRSFLASGTAVFELAIGRTRKFYVTDRSTNDQEKLPADIGIELDREIAQVQETLVQRGYTEISAVVSFFGERSAVE